MYGNKTNYSLILLLYSIPCAHKQLLGIWQMLLVTLCTHLSLSVYCQTDNMCLDMS